MSEDTRPWCWGETENEDGYHRVDSREEAIESAVEWWIDEQDPDATYTHTDIRDGMEIGRIREYGFTWYPYGDWLVEQLSEQAGEEAGEWEEDWPDVTDAQTADLEARVNAVIAQWLKDCGQDEPTFGTCEDMEHPTLAEIDAAVQEIAARQKRVAASLAAEEA